MDVKQTKPQVMSASTLMDNPVKNPEGDDLGKIEEFMIDLDGGKIAYAVLSFGGILGVGDKLFAIPFNALKLDMDEECFVLDVDKDELKDAPGFDKDDWPDMANYKWGEDIYSYYHQDPYWA